MNPILTGRISRSVASLCLLVPLACSATGDRTSRTISQSDGAGGAGFGGAAGAITGGGATGIGAVHGVEAPGSSSSAGGMQIISVIPGESDPGGCTKDQNILFVIDRSGSMQCNPPGPTLRGSR